MKKKLFLSSVFCFSLLLFSSTDSILANSNSNITIENLGNAKVATSESGNNLKSKESYESEISKIQNEIKVLENLKVVYKNDRESLSKDIEELNLKISEKENLINALLDSIKNKESELSKTENELLDVLKEIDKMEVEKLKREESFKGRLSSIYKNKEINIVEVVIESESFGDMINRFVNYKTIVDSDNKAIEEYFDLLERLDKAKEKLEDLKSQLKFQLENLNSEKLKSEKEQLNLKNLKVEKERQSMSTEEILSSIDKDISTLKNSISILETNKNKAEIYEELQSRVSKEVSEGLKNQSIYRYADLSSSDYINESVSEEISLGKMFITPTIGRFTSGYGPRFIGGVYDFHMGIDLANELGTEVLASAEGTVLNAGPYSSYGNAIFISHNIDGKEFVTVYGHLSVVGVKKGDIVKQGQIIGLMGSTGRSTGPHLHFEIQPNTSKYDYSKGIDPWKYLTTNITNNILREGYKSTNK